jgi:hypothetical protein
MSIEFRVEGMALSFGADLRNVKAFRAINIQTSQGLELRMAK